MVRSCLAIADHCVFELTAGVLWRGSRGTGSDVTVCCELDVVCGSRFVSSCSHSTVKASNGTGPPTDGIWCGDSPTFQYLVPSFRMVCSCEANCVSSPMSMFASMPLTMYASTPLRHTGPN